MFKKYRSVVLSSSFAIVVAAATPVVELLPSPPSFEGTCRVSVSKMGGQRYASIKCQRAKKPGRDIISSTFWENRSKKDFDELAKFAGRRMTCHFQKSGTTFSGDEVVDFYEITDCR